MSFFDRFSPFKAILRSWLEDKWLKLTELDGKPGLQIADLIEAGKIAQSINKQHVGATNEQKAKKLAEFIARAFGDRIPSWVITRLAELAYDYGRLKGFIK